MVAVCGDAIFIVISGGRLLQCTPTMFFRLMNSLAEGLFVINRAMWCGRMDGKSAWLRPIGRSLSSATSSKASELGAGSGMKKIA